MRKAFLLLYILTINAAAQAPQRQCDNAAMIRALYLASELLEPEATPQPLPSFQISVPPLPVAPTTPGPAWIPPARCNPRHAEPLGDEGLRRLAEMDAYIDRFAYQRGFTACWVFPVGLTIPAQWWSYQRAQFCGEPELDQIEADGALHRYCWGDIARANAGLQIPGTPSEAPRVAVTRPQMPRTTPTRANRSEQMNEFLSLSRLCGTMRQ